MKKKLAMIRRSCPVCGSRNESQVFVEADFDAGLFGEFAFASRKLPELMHYRLIICPECDLLYANPVPTLKILSKAYHEAAFDSAEEARYAARTYAGFLDGILKTLSFPKGALDIGTGDGAFLLELIKKGFTDVLGVEPSKAPIQIAPQEVKKLIRHALFRPENFKKESMCLVTCFQTFEHLMDPRKMLEGSYKILGKGGVFFGVFHNRRSLSASILGLKSPIFDIEHLQLFSKTSVKALFEKAGFKEVKVKTILNTYPLHYWMKLLPFPRRFKLVFIGLLKKTGLGYLPISLPAGNMAVMGYKKPTS